MIFFHKLGASNTHFHWSLRKVWNHSRLYSNVYKCTPWAIQIRIRAHVKAKSNCTLVGDEAFQWYNSYVLVPKPNGCVYLHLDVARLKQVLTRLVHIGWRVNDIFKELVNSCYLTLISVSLGYYNLKLDRILFYLTTFHANFVDTGMWDYQLFGASRCHNAT